MQIMRLERLYAKEIFLTRRLDAKDETRVREIICRGDLLDNEN